MLAEAIKTALGADLSAQVETALKGKGKDGKDLDLVIGNDGSYVPATKYNDEKDRADSAEKALKAAADGLKEIGGSGDAQKLADDVKAAQEKMTTLQTDHQKEIGSIRKNAALRAALSGKAHDPADIISMLDLEKIEVDDNGGLKSDLDVLLKPIKETKGYLFKEDTPGVIVKGAKPADPTAGKNPAGGYTDAQIRAVMGIPTAK